LSLVVHKYGGSSVADLSAIRRVAERVAASVSAGDRVVVVVSAMGNTTSELLSLARQVSTSPDRRELDMLVSVGERISMALLAIALRDCGIAARSLTGSQAGIVTDEAHGDARVVEVRPERLRQAIEAGEVPIVAGFQGVSRDREVTTLGRGGSDTTAVVLAAALGADWCEICSDVDGVYTADPRVVPDAIRLDELSLDEALSLARGGAKVLFEDAVRYARDHGVEIRAVSTFGPGSGTRLRVSAGVDGEVRAVTGDDQIVVLAMPETRSAVDALRAGGARVRRVMDATLYVDVRNLHGGSISSMHDGVRLIRHAALVTAAGSGLGQRLDLVAKGRSALVTEGIDMLASGADADSVWFEVPPSCLDDAVRALYRVLLPA
jgi:aspartate kinase